MIKIKNILLCAILLFIAVAGFFACKQPIAPKARTFVFIGSYTDGVPDKGIYLYQLDTSTGALTFVSNTEQITNPSYLSLSPDGSHLYACTETRMSDAGSISAFAFDSLQGKLTFLNKQPSGGENPVYLAVHNSGKWLVNANYTGGSISVYPIGRDGLLMPLSQIIHFDDSSVNEDRQESSHIHSVVYSPDQDTLFAPDLGADKIRAFSFNQGQLIPTSMPNIQTDTGCGPRHLVFSPSGRYAYCTEELTGTVTAYNYQNGSLIRLQRLPTYTHQQDEYANSDLQLSPDGQYLYVANREEEHNVAIFRVDILTGLLTPLGHMGTLGVHPRSIAIDPSGKFLLVANQLSNNVSVFYRNPNTGLITYTGHEISIPHPACLKIRTYQK